MTRTVPVRIESVRLSDTAVRWLGAFVAALAGVAVLILGFARWYGAGESARSGWNVVGGAGTLIVGMTVIAGFLPLPVVALPRHVARWMSAALSMVALGAALLIVFRVARDTAGFSRRAASRWHRRWPWARASRSWSE